MTPNLPQKRFALSCAVDVRTDLFLQADNLEIKVGAPLWPDTWNDRAIAAYYSTTPLHADTFFNNIVQTILLRERTGWSLFGQQRDRRRWEMFASTVNAYFEPPGTLCTAANCPSRWLTPYPFSQRDCVPCWHPPATILLGQVPAVSQLRWLRNGCCS